MGKTMCSLYKLATTNKGEFVKLIDTPKYYCEKCGRMANLSENLCKPQPLNIVDNISSDEENIIKLQNELTPELREYIKTKVKKVVKKAEKDQELTPELKDYIKAKIKKVVKEELK